MSLSKARSFVNSLQEGLLLLAVYPHEVLVYEAGVLRRIAMIWNLLGL